MFDGLGGAVVGALVGGLVSLWIAWLVLDRTRRDNEDLAREQASLAAARDLGLALHRLAIDLRDLHSLPDANGYNLVESVNQTFEQEIVVHLPALREPEFRRAVEGVHTLLRNFNYFAFESGAVTDKWRRSGPRANVQQADYITLLGDALCAYRSGESVVIPKRPGWRKYQGDWWWCIPPGMHVDGSGDPNPGWEPGAVDGQEYWLDRGEPEQRQSLHA